MHEYERFIDAVQRSQKIKNEIFKLLVLAGTGPYQVQVILLVLITTRGSLDIIVFL